MRLLVLVLILAVIDSAGIARAYWHGSGSGTGAAVTGTGVALTLGPGTPAATLYPGGRADVMLAVSNPNASAMFIGSLALDTGQGTGGFAVDVGHAGCALATLSFTSQTNAGAGWTVPPKAGLVNGTLSVGLTDALTMGLDAANACQGGRFTIYLVAGP